MSEAQTRGLLRSAHRGYAYQDLLCAIRLVDLLLGSAASVRIDQKLVANDPYDDLTTYWASGVRERCQIKYRDTTNLPLPLATFTSDVRGCRLDRLVAAAVADRNASGATDTHLFRLVLRDSLPQHAALTTVLRSPSPDPGPR